MIQACGLVTALLLDRMYMYRLRPCHVLSYFVQLQMRLRSGGAPSLASISMSASSTKICTGAGTASYCSRCVAALERVLMPESVSSRFPFTCVAQEHPLPDLLLHRPPATYLKSCSPKKAAQQVTDVHVMPARML